MAIDNKHVGDTLVLEMTNGHKDTVDKLVKAYKIKDGDEAKLIAFLIEAASQDGVIGNPIGANGKFFAPLDSWVDTE